MTTVDLTSSDEEIRLEIQRLDAEEQTHLALAEGSQKVLVDGLAMVRAIGPRIQKALDENNFEEVQAGLDQFIEIFSTFPELIALQMNSYREANEAKLWKDKYEFLLTLPEGE